MIVTLPVTRKAILTLVCASVLCTVLLATQGLRAQTPAPGKAPVVSPTPDACLGVSDDTFSWECYVQNERDARALYDAQCQDGVHLC